MTKKLMVALAATLVTHSAAALSQCPGDLKACGPNPFYILVIGLAQVCSEKFPDNAARYSKARADMVAENPMAYAKIDADAEFQKKLLTVLQEFRKLPVVELLNECKTLTPETAKRETP